jgi:hypothetical protein
MTRSARASTVGGLAAFAAVYAIAGTPLALAVFALHLPHVLPALPTTGNARSGHGRRHSSSEPPRKPRMPTDTPLASTAPYPAAA